MEQKQAFTAEKLDDIVHFVQKRRKTGRLVAKIREGNTILEGEIIFVAGHITWASVGSLSDTEAIKWLSTFGNACACMFVSLTDAQAIEPTAPPFISLNGHPSSRRVNSEQQRGLLLSSNGSGVGMKSRYLSTPETVIPYTIRQHNRALHLIEKASLSRAHRRLFLLVDGNRSISELQRLMGRSQAEINSLLRDLERASTIRIPP